MLRAIVLSKYDVFTILGILFCHYERMVKLGGVGGVKWYIGGQVQLGGSGT